MKKLAVLLLALLLQPVMASDFPEGSPKFGSEYQAALDAGKKDNKPVIVVFSAVWCGPCQSMKKSVYPSAEVKPYHDKFVWAYLDYDLEANQKLGSKFGVQGIPHIQFLNGEGKDLGSQLGGLPPAEFAAKLEEVLKKSKE